MNHDFWRGKCVFVTWHVGFKGGCLVLPLRSLGHRVTGYADKAFICSGRAADRTLTSI
jgi:hypothetical protein